MSPRRISFYNPNKINPVLNVNLETTVQGVDVSVSVSGSMDKLKLTYHSDPPLEFQQIVSLLASGKQPTTDPSSVLGCAGIHPVSRPKMGCGPRAEAPIAGCG